MAPLLASFAIYLSNPAASPRGFFFSVDQNDAQVILPRPDQTTITGRKIKTALQPIGRRAYLRHLPTVQSVSHP